MSTVSFASEMAGKKKRLTLDEELHEVGLAAADPRSAESTGRLKVGLRSPRSFVVARAATLIKDRRLEGFDELLRDAFTRFLEDPVKSDPGCKAKLAALEALDFTESMDADPFLTGARYVQKEAAWGPPVDTATGVRGRSVAALARIGYADLVLLAGELLDDPESPVRTAAADALAHYGVRHGACPVLLKLSVGDDDPLVTLACMSALISLAPEVGVPKLRPLLAGKNPEKRELAALAFGQSGRDDAVELLIAAVTSCVLEADREVLLRALGLHRSDKAANHLLTIISEGPEKDAKAAVSALATRRFEPGMRERALEAGRANSKVDLRRSLAESFPEEG